MEHRADPGGDGEDRPGQGRSSLGRPAGPDDLRPAPVTQRVNGHRPTLGNPPAGTGAGRDSAPGRPPGAGPDGPGLDEEPIWKRHRPPLFYQPRVVMAVLLLVLFVGGIALAARHHPWPPKPSCGTPTIALNIDHTRTGYPVYWAATGRPGRYAVTVGASSVALSGGKLTITGSEALGGDKATVVRQPTRMTGCRWLGHFSMPLPYGQYSLRLYRIHDGHATLADKTRIDSDG